MSDVVVVLTTVGDDAAAVALADAVVERRLAACAKRRPVSSTYHWHGAIEHADEVALEMVTAVERVEALCAFVARHHDYDLPELISWRVAASPQYAEWVIAETTPTAEPGPTTEIG